MSGPRRLTIYIFFIRQKCYIFSTCCDILIFFSNTEVVKVMCACYGDFNMADKSWAQNSDYLVLLFERRF